LIICNNVIQHVPTLDLIREFADFARALKPNGTFALQFVSGNDTHDCGIEFTEKQANKGFLCRTPDVIEALLNDVSLKCKKVSSWEADFPPIAAAHVIHATKG